jgi:PIN domain nuclease of toxin-antitoxin system
VRLLIDTHILLWTANADARLEQTAIDLIENPETELLLSMASVWEMAIKINLGKLQLGKPLKDFMEETTRLYNVELLPIQLEHLIPIESLPQHHRDPFDRLLIAQAMVENIPILSQDTAFHQYPIQLLP